MLRFFQLFNTDTKKIIAITIACLFALVAIGTYADLQIVDYTPEGAVPININAGSDRPFHALNKWDANHYANIAENGYTANEVAFFPLYPLLVRGLTALGVPTKIALLAISWTFCLLATVVLLHWFKFELQQRKSKLSPWVPMLIFAVFPTSFYLGLGYSESMFIFLATLALLAYRKGWYWIAAVAMAFVTATRVQGGAIAVFFLIDFLMAQKRDYRKLLPILCAGIGIGVYMIYLWNTFGNPFEFIAVQKNWGRLSGNPVQNLISSFTPVYLWYLPVLGLGLYATWKHLGFKWLAFSLIFILIPLASGRLDSLNRYMLALPVLFLALTLWFEQHGNKTKTAYVVSASFMLCWNIILFCNNYWVA